MYDRLPVVSDDLQNFFAKVELELKLLNTVSAGISGPVVVPVGGVAVSTDTSVGYENSAGRTSNLKFLVSMKELRRDNCASLYGPYWTSIEQAPSNLGLGDWLVAALSATHHPTIVKKREIEKIGIDTISYQIEFIVEPKAGSLTGFALRQWTPKIDGGVSLRNIQTLNISFTRNAPDPSPTMVQIVGWPKRKLNVVGETPLPRPPLPKVGPPPSGPPNVEVLKPLGAPTAPSASDSPPAAETTPAPSAAAKSPGAGSAKRPCRSPVTEMPPRAPSTQVSPATENKLDRELFQNRIPSLYGDRRAPIGF